MNEKDIETFIYIGSEKMLICIFSKIDSKILYKKESKYLELNDYTRENKIISFLSENIFKIEKKLNLFINNVVLIINSNQFQSIHISIKQSIYGEVTKKNLLNMLKDLKNCIFYNYLDYTIIHYVVNHYLFDNNIYKNFDFIKKCNHLCLDTTFIMLNRNDALIYKKIFEKFQISVEKILCGKYVFNYFDTKEFNECEMGKKILLGFNPNEVFLIKKNAEIKGFFERFFNFF